ncbi:MAG: urease accessory protein UreD [Dongiaceae bacterium]
MLDHAGPAILPTPAAPPAAAGDPVAPDPAWVIGKYGLLNVEGVVRDGRTVLEPRSWRIPYQWQGYHYQDHDDEPFLPLVNSSGGFVEGDVSHLTARLGSGTRTLITTTAASKFYKCLEGGTSHEIVEIRVADDAALEYCPDESIPFADSRVRRITRLALAPSARLFATDMISAGRVHYRDGECFRFTSLFSEFEVRVAGRPLVIDRLVAEDPATVAALPRLWRGALHMATVLSYAPDLPPGIEEQLAGIVVEGTELGATRIGQLAVLRILSVETWQAHEALYRAWEVLRPPIMGKPARPIRKC